MRRRPVRLAICRGFVHLFFLLATLMALHAQPAAHSGVLAQDVDTQLRPCTELLPAPEGNESFYEPAIRDGCAGEIAKLTTSIVDRVRQYFTKTLMARTLGLAAAGLITGGLLFVAIALAERRRIVSSGHLALVRFAAAVVAGALVAGFSLYVQSTVEPAFIAADRDLRSMYRLGVVPRAGRANAHAAVQLELLLSNTEMKAAEIVARYPGLTTAFHPITIVAGTDVTRTELAFRVTDMVKALEGFSVDQKIQPRSAADVFVTNGIFLNARREWDRFGFLSRWWLPPMLAAGLALLVHWVLLWGRELNTRRRIAKVVGGQRHQPAIPV